MVKFMVVGYRRSDLSREDFRGRRPRAARDYRRDTMTALRFCAVLLLASGCAGLEKTPAQERVMRHVNDCAPGTSVRAVVSRDGSVRLEGSQDELPHVQRCLTERYGYRWR
jgi:hypothetical protein